MSLDRFQARFAKSFPDVNITGHLSDGRGQVEGQIGDIYFRVEIKGRVAILESLQARGGKGTGKGNGAKVVGILGETLRDMGKEALGVSQGNDYWDRDARFERYSFPVTHIWDLSGSE